MENLLNTNGVHYIVEKRNVFGFMAAATKANLPDLCGWILFNFFFWGRPPYRQHDNSFGRLKVLGFWRREVKLLLQNMSFEVVFMMKSEFCLTFEQRIKFFAF
jgi:hypothetical protein